MVFARAPAPPEENTLVAERNQRVSHRRLLECYSPAPGEVNSIVRLLEEIMFFSKSEGNYLKKILFISIIMLFVVPCSAQDKKDSNQPKPDFTGTWELDPSRSTNSEGSRGKRSVRLMISHKEPELKIMRRANNNGKEFNNDSVFYTDNRGESNIAIFQGALGITGGSEGPAENEELKSKTKWDGNKLVSRSTVRFVVSGYSVFLNVTEKRELSADGKTLTITITFNAPAGSGGMTKEVFTRVL